MEPVELLVEVIKEHAPKNIWVTSPLLGYRNLGNTNRGQIGEEFLKRYLTAAGLSVVSGSRTSLTDLKIEGRAYEVKTASMGVNKTFQFNHVRLDRKYEYLLCLGICPEQIVFNVWRKGDVAEGKAGTMVRMAEGQSVTAKITKKLRDMKPIEELAAHLATHN